MAEAICSVEGCDKPTKAFGWCGTHYQRWRKHGAIRPDIPIGGSFREEHQCSIEGCERPARARGWCKLHWDRWHRWGDPTFLGFRWPKRDTLAERFWDRVERSPNCWEWLGGKTPSGYGMITFPRDKNHLAHRVAYELLVGPIPDGMQLDHLCRNRGCVNPAHLEAVTLRTNILRGVGITAVNATKTHCSRGHLFDEANTYWFGRHRHCRACARERARLQAR